MKLIFNSRIKRNTAFFVLFTWLFALASGVANACVIEPRGTYSDDFVVASAVAAAEMAEAETAPDQVVGAVGHHHHDSDAPGTPCQKVCDEGSNALTKQQSTSISTNLDLAPFFAFAWTSSKTAIVWAPSQAGTHEPAPPRLSVRVLFSRLAL